MERIQQVQQQHPDMQQRYFENHLNQERIKKLHKANDFEEMERIKLRDKEERGHHRNQHRNGETQEVPAETSTSRDESGHIDIKI
jgi:hypothetical protein